MSTPAPSFLTRSFGTILWFAIVSVASATPVKFDIPAQPASSALQLFGRQAGAEVVYPATELKKIQAAEVKGEMEPVDALKKLLDRTGYEGMQTAEKSFVVKKTETPTTGSVKGSLTGEGGKGLPNVLVTIWETAQSAETDRYGVFVFPNVAAGTYVLVASAPGYQTMKIDGVNVKAGRELTIGKEEMRKPGEGPLALEPFVVHADTVEQLEKFIVTDTKPKPFSDRNVDLPRTINDVQPYYIFTAETIEQSGAINIEDFLKNRLTMNTVAQTNSQMTVFGSGSANAFLGGTSTINLRGLGKNETLILVDGHRLAGVVSNGSAFQPDVNGLPLAAIDRIEVLPSSAGAIYGGGAVGGVINIVLKKDYSGGDIRVTYDATGDGYGPLRTASVTYGAAFEGGRSHLMVTAQYSDSKPLYLQQRVNLVNRGYFTILKNDPTFFGYNPGSPASGSLLLASTPNLIGYDPATGNPTNLTFQNSSQSLNSPIATLPSGYSAGSNPSTIIGGQWNSTLPPTNQSPNGLLLPLGSFPKNKSLTATFSRQLLVRVEFFAELTYAANNTFSNWNPLDQINGTLTLLPSAPTNPFNQVLTIAIPDNSAPTPAISHSVTRSITSGFRLKLPFDWAGEMDYTWSQNKFNFTTQEYDTNPLNRDIQSGAIDPLVDTIAHPIDFSRYLYNILNTGSSEIHDYTIRGSGPVVHLPWGNPTLTLNLERRVEKSPDATVPTIYPLSPTRDEIDTYYAHQQSIDSIYLEGNIPVVTRENALPGLQGLEFQLADRTESYSVSTGTFMSRFLPNRPPPNNLLYIPTPPDALPNGRGGSVYHARANYSRSNQTFGLKYTPIEDITFRASYATSFIPPTFSQLLPPARVDRFTSQIIDPMTGQSYFVQTYSGGNPKLTPEHDKNWDIGVIYEPHGTLLRGLRVNLEYYAIKQLDYITTPTLTQILNTPTLASRINRDPTTGQVNVIDDTLLNAPEFVTKGWDLSVDYRRSTSAGVWEFTAAGTVIEHEKRQLVLAGPIGEYVGFPSEGGEAKTKANATLTWTRRPWTLGWTTRWYGSYFQFGTPTGPISQNQTLYTLAQGSDLIPTQVYHDAFVRYAFPERAKSKSKDVLSRLTNGLSLQVVVKNVFNTLPPFDAYYAPFYTSPYGDIRLRDIELSLSKEF